eukprot:1892964-Alexandrium_andersonii.AAC.1
MMFPAACWATPRFTPCIASFKTRVCLKPLALTKGHLSLGSVDARYSSCETSVPSQHAVSRNRSVNEHSMLFCEAQHRWHN